LESRLNIPIVDETGLAGRYDIDLRWDRTDFQPQLVDSIKQVLLDDLGLELTPAKLPVDMLVVERAK